MPFLRKYSFRNLGNNIELVSWFTLFTIIYIFEWGLHCKSFRGDLWKNDLINKIMNSCLFCIKCHMQRYCFIEDFHSSRDNMYVYWIVQAIADYFDVWIQCLHFASFMILSYCFFFEPGKQQGRPPLLYFINTQKNKYWAKQTENTSANP